jgi:hypothetical protein
VSTRPIAPERGKLAGAKVFVLGNGPSLRELDLSRLVGQRVIGMNASTLLEASAGFVSDFYVVSDARFLEHPEKRPCATNLLHPSTQRVLRADLREVDEESLRADTLYVRAIARNGFSNDLERGYYFGCTTTMLAVQLAAYLGCRSIYLLGCDFKYNGPTPRFYAEAIPQEPDPFLSVQLWNLRNAYRELERIGVGLFHCTPDSNLAPYLPFCDFDEALTR